MTYKKKMLSIAGGVLLLVILFLVYKKDIFKWSCHEENVYSSCLIVGMYEEEEGNMSKAVEYYTLSCDGKYALGCDWLVRYHTAKGDESKAKLYSRRSCKIKQEDDCDKIK